MTDKFDIITFEEVKNKTKVSITCKDIKEEMEIVDIKYFPEGIFNGLSPLASTMVVAVSKHDLFAPKVYTGAGFLFYEDGTAWNPIWDKDSEDGEIMNGKDFIIDLFTDWEARKECGILKSSPFELQITYNPNYTNEDGSEAESINKIRICSDVVLSDNLYISAQTLKDYIMSIITNIYADKCDPEVLDIKNDLLQQVLSILKNYNNYVLIDSKKTKESDYVTKKYTDTINPDSDERYSKSTVVVETDKGNWKTVNSDELTTKDKNIVVDINGDSYEPVLPNDRTSGFSSKERESIMSNLLQELQ